MKLTEVSNCAKGVRNLVAIDFDTWHIDGIRNLVLKLGNSFNSSLFLVYCSSEKQFQTVVWSEAEDILQPPFYPIDITEIIFEKIV